MHLVVKNFGTNLILTWYIHLTYKYRLGTYLARTRYVHCTTEYKVTYNPAVTEYIPHMQQVNTSYVLSLYQAVLYFAVN